MSSDYWSCSKFADWLRGTSKPSARREKDWDTWKKSAQKKSFRYWLAEEGLDRLQNLLNWPKNRLNDVRHYCNNRWIYKTHSLNSRLKPGQWYDFDTRMFHAAFDSLVNFVEIEQAWLNVICSDKAYKKYRKRWYYFFLFTHQWRSPEAGLDYLKWAANLRHDEEWLDKNDPEFGKPTQQSIAAKETLELYTWWKEIRPKRPDPIDTSGLNNYWKEKHLAAQDQGIEFQLLDRDKEGPDRDHFNQLMENCHRIEQEQAEEDTEMLIRLVKIRGSLWT